MKLFGVHRGGEDIAGQIEIDRPLLAVRRFAKSQADVIRDARRDIDPIRGLDHRPHHRNLVHLLERIHGGAAHRRRAADRDYRGRVAPGVGEPRNRVGGSRTRRGDADARFAGDPRVGVSHHRGGLLVAHVNPLHAPFEAGGRGPAGRPAHHEEDGVNALVLEAFPDYLLAP